MVNEEESGLIGLVCRVLRATPPVCLWMNCLEVAGLTPTHFKTDPFLNCTSGSNLRPPTADQLSRKAERSTSPGCRCTYLTADPRMKQLRTDSCSSSSNSSNSSSSSSSMRPQANEDIRADRHRAHTEASWILSQQQLVQLSSSNSHAID
ncbi:hypothetical protein Efla_004664 [Eimeria flavescens]